MANASMISGLRPVRNAVSGYYSGSKIMCFIPATDVDNIAVGDPVTLTGGSNPAQVSGYTFAQIEAAAPEVRRALPGEAIWGVIDSFEPRAVVGYETTPYRAGLVAMFCHVMVDPNVEYEIQGRTGVAFTGAMVGQTCNIVAGATDTIYGRSGYEADLTTLGNSAANQLLILGIQEREADNEIGDLAKLRVKINASQFSNTGVAGA